MKKSVKYSLKNKHYQKNYRSYFNYLCNIKLAKLSLLLNLINARDFYLKGLLSTGIFLAQIPLITTTPKSALANDLVCGSPGIDGVTNLNTVINTFFVGGGAGAVASPGSTSMNLGAYDTDGAAIPITAGDMLMIIQMQDATIDPSNDATYGSGNAANDGSGATSIGNSGIYEFVRATNSVPLTGGILEFEGGGVGGGLVNTYVNATSSLTQGNKSFQVVRVPQFATLTLGSNLEVPDWDGNSGGVLALDVTGSLNFNGFTIDGTDKGFRGGYTPIGNSGINIADYVFSAGTTLGGGKGEGIAGTPRYTWDGINANDLGSDQLPGGDAGRGAPGNAGGGGNDHNSGGGGGGNSNRGGMGGIGWENNDGNSNDLSYFTPPANNTTNTPGGRGGDVPATPSIQRLIMGGGGGGGDANNELNGVRGGQGGGIVMIRAGQILGTGTIISNGSDGEDGEVGGSGDAPDGAGGGGAGGTVAVIADNGNLGGISVQVQGGDGGNTVNDGGSPHFPHGPGGGGSGGIVISYSPGGGVGSVDNSGGIPGRTEGGAGITHGSTTGEQGQSTLTQQSEVPPILSGAECYPALEVTKTEANPGAAGERFAPNTATYNITVTNTESGSAAGVRIKDTLPTGFTYSSGATAVLNGGAIGSTSPTNSGTASAPEFGEYLIPGGASVTITLEVDIASNTPTGVYQNPAYVTYLDPARSTPGRLITPAAGADASDNTTYESGVNAGQPVPGNNYVSASSAGEDVHISNVSPAAGQVIINEVLYRQTGSSAASNDEFIELYNPTNAAVDMSNWQLIDGNLQIDDTDGGGGINDSAPFVFPAGTILDPGDYIVVWVGDNTVNKQANDAAFQFYLDNDPRLNNDGDDVWLYDPQTRIVDYMAYGTGSAINTPPDASLNLWDSTNQSAINNTSQTGQSISLTPNGQDGNTSACWEPTTSNDATNRCPGFLPTRDTDEVGNRVTSVGLNNNGFKLSGTVFEDVNYGGGAGRNFTTAEASAISSGFTVNGTNATGIENARVELYSYDGNDISTSKFIEATTTDNDGNYDFYTNNGNYLIRVVNSTVETNRPSNSTGLTPFGVQTFRNDTDATTSEIINEVGGANPAVTDAGNVTTIDASLPNNAQSITAIDVNNNTLDNLDFGFNFDTIVNTNASGQGSLRQFTFNSNELANTNLAQDLPAAITPPLDSNGNAVTLNDYETSIFMIPDPNNDSRVTAGTGVGEINLSSAPPDGGTNAFVIDTNSTFQPLIIVDNYTSIDGRTQAVNIPTISNTPNLTIGNNETTGAEVIISKSFGADMIYGQFDHLIFHSFGIVSEGNTNSVGIRLADNGSDVTQSSDTTNVIIDSLTVVTSNCGIQGVMMTDSVIRNSVIRDSGAESRCDNIQLRRNSNRNLIEDNLILRSSHYGINLEIVSNIDNIIQRNQIVGNGIANDNNRTAGIGIRNGTNTTIENNIIRENVGDGITVTNDSNTNNSNLIRQNSIYNNGDLGIDLGGGNAGDGVSSNDSADADTGANQAQNFPEITNITSDGSNYTIEGNLDSTPSSDFEIELFSNAVCNADINGTTQTDKYGEGEKYHVTIPVTTDNTGKTTFSTTVAISDLAGNVITSTATSTAISNTNTSEFSQCFATRPNLLLVKRITAINPDQADKMIFTSFVNDSTDRDNNDRWLGSNGNTNTYTLGKIDGGKVKPNDEVEYSIYFLSNGSDTAQNVLVCDLVPEHMEFVANGFQNETPATGGLPGAQRGILWEYNGAIESLTNGNDGDAGYYFPPGDEPTTVFPNIKCGDPSQSNTNGAVVVDLGNLPSAISPGTPSNSYGFVRFRARVK